MMTRKKPSAAALAAFRAAQRPIDASTPQPRGKAKAHRYDALYEDAAWTVRRQQQLREQPWCQACLGRSNWVPATIVDHAEPHLGDPERFMKGALVSCCKAHRDRWRRAGAAWAE
jgi:hypothetical protein